MFRVLIVIYQRMISTFWDQHGSVMARSANSIVLDEAFFLQNFTFLIVTDRLWSRELNKNALKK